MMNQVFQLRSPLDIHRPRPGAAGRSMRHRMRMLTSRLRRPCAPRIEELDAAETGRVDDDEATVDWTPLGAQQVSVATHVKCD